MSPRSIRFALCLGLAAFFIVWTPACQTAQKASKPFMTNAPALEELDSMEVVKRMGLGWNLGNTMEACGDWIKPGDIRNYETAWGNPETTREIIGAIKAAGFKSIRIPVAWSNMMQSNNVIHFLLMERVKEIVDDSLEEGLIVVVNIHWDGGWWSKFPTEYDKSMKRYTKMWSQIAGQFKDYPSTLIFESLNEEGCFNDLWNRWGAPAPEQKQKAYGILNNINQAFVDLVRNSGGMNAKRHLLIAGYATDIDLTVDPLFVMPKDPAGHGIVSVHYYTPFTFAGLEKDETWGKMRPTWGTKEDYAELDSNMRKLKTRYLDQGVPVIVGEYSATTKKEPESVRRYILSVARLSHGMGMCPMLWDAGQHFDRRALKFKDPELLEGFQKINSGVKVDEAEFNDNANEPAAFSSSIPGELLRQARKNAQSPETREFEKLFSTSVGEDLSGFLSVCTRATPLKGSSLVVLKLEKSGRVSDVYADQNDPVAGCVARKLASEKCPRPPFAPYLKLVEMSVKN